MKQKTMIYYYEVYYWDEVEEARRTAKGIILGETMGAAVNRIVDFYGADEVFDVKVYKMTGDEGDVNEPLEFKKFFDLAIDQEEGIKPDLFAFH